MYQAIQAFATSSMQIETCVFLIVPRMLLLSFEFISTLGAIGIIRNLHRQLDLALLARLSLRRFESHHFAEHTRIESLAIAAACDEH